MIRLIPELFILFDAVVSGTGFLHFFSRPLIVRVTEMQRTFTLQFISWYSPVCALVLTAFCFLVWGGQNICGFPLVKSLNL